MTSSDAPSLPPQSTGGVRVDAFDLSEYALVIDARSPQEFAEDHIPGAVNLPVVNDEQFAEVGIAYKADPHTAYVVGAQYALRNIANHVGTLIKSFPANSRLLVYCYRGGKRSKAWAEPLRGIGYSTDILQGGWKAYRRAVLEALASLPLQFDYRVVGGSTGSGKTRLLQALSAIGQQVIDLEGLAVHKGSLLGLMPGDKQPPQKMFDTELLHLMRTFDPSKPVWVEAESKKVGLIQIPDSMLHAMGSALRFEVRAPVPERVRLLREEYPHLASEPMEVVARLEPLKRQVGAKELEEWRQLAESRRIDDLVTRLLHVHYDPSYARSTQRSRAADAGLVPVDLPDLSQDTILAAAKDLAERYGEARRSAASE